ncbi:hypothetical protein IQ13_0096 [Lacibacter cauensis]|uniref:Uncharacterized protein n=1 Tax=Lacibacter cauensis TaxID=510947 RepID=A0A562SUT1_9BACT|nr:hypothetical protein [Lacibacter cauensis]TWI84943.1 hypothetical protein IQ13_0096 [Lacibacter cauensis]
MQLSDSYQKMITALQDAKPALADADGLANSIIEAIEKDKVSQQKSRIYYLFRNVTVSAAAMLAGVFLYQTFLVDEEQSQTKPGIAINAEAPEKPALIDRENLVQSLMTYINDQKTARDKFKRNMQDYTFNNINPR